MAANLLAYVVAIAIPLLAIYLIYALDLFGTGKIGTVVICMIWGGSFAFAAAFVINSAMIPVFGATTVVTRTAPIIEELLKAVILVYFIRSPRFRYLVDGAVYGFGAGIGFALVENISYLSTTDAGLTLAIMRVLSTSLMHATASALVGIALGRLRRIDSRIKVGLPLAGIGLAVVLHILYNSLVNQLSGTILLLVAIGIGIGGSVVIAFLINQSIAEEKASFTRTLSRDLNVASGERKALQRLGGAAIEKEFQELEARFGSDNITLIRRLLVLQANIGILQNNLTAANVSPRLRAAWDKELTTLQAEVTEVRKKLGLYVATYLQSMFPPEDVAMWELLNEEMAEYDPTLINKFDMFMRVSQMAESFTPQQLEEMAHKLQHIDILRYISPADLENLSRALEVVEFEAGVMLFDQGEPGDSMYLIEQGTIEVFTLDDQRREQLFRTFQPGEVVGDFAVLDGKPRSARARAAGGLRAWMLTREVFLMFIQSRPQVILSVLRVLAEKARYTTEAVQASVELASTLAQGSTIPAAAPMPAPAMAQSASELVMHRREEIADVFAQAAVSLNTPPKPLE
jgi:RsiW-degrading membrane proteinase PrsW (M82 family)/CRP-like cAMP-binding protein